MAESKAKGSFILKLIAFLLVGVVIAAILLPDKEWKKQDAEKELCRAHMEDLFFTTLQYLKEFKTYQTNLDTLLNFIENDSMMVPPGVMEIERLTVWESPRDSFLVGFSDLFHFERIDWQTVSKDTVILQLMPKDRFQLIPETKVVFASNDSIFVERRQKGEHDINVTVWGKSVIQYNRVEVDSAYIPTKFFAVSKDPKDYFNCPACNQPYKVSVNINVKIKGEISYTVLSKTGGNVAGDNFYSNLFVKKLRADALNQTLEKFKADTTIFTSKKQFAVIQVLGKIPPDSIEISSADSVKIASLVDSLLNAAKDSMIIANFTRSFTALKPKSVITLEEESTQMVTAPEVASWNDPEKIKSTLFKPELTDAETKLSSQVNISELFSRLEAVPKYFVVRTDSVGLTIACPIDSIYYDPDKNFIDKLFGVGPVHNHGQIMNSDYSWSEKK